MCAARPTMSLSTGTPMQRSGAPPESPRPRATPDTETDRHVAVARGLPMIAAGGGAVHIKGRRRVVAVICLAVASAICGCATISTYTPPDPGRVAFRERAVSKTEGALTVTVAIPSPAESRELFGFKIDKKRIQPIWLQIDNRSDREHWFFVRNLDPDYFSPLEVAWMGRKSYTKHARAEMERALFDCQIPLRIPGGQVVSGFVFANQILGGRHVLVELIDEEREVLRFDFMVQIPGLRTDYKRVDADSLYSHYVDLDEEGLRRWIEEQPCCVTNAKGTKFGDPLNLVLVGTSEALWPAFARAGWNVTEVASTSSVWKTIKSSLFRTRYLYSPISSLYAFGRPQDIALQKARGTVDERNHLRLWLAPVTHKGQPVLIGQISRDIGVRFTTKSPTISTHKIDPDVDETRAYLLMDLVYAQGVARFGLEGGVGTSPIDEPRGNLTDDPYVTDGLRLVLFMSEDPVPIEQVDYLEWKEGQRH